MRRALFITLHFPPSRDIGAHACEQIARYLPLYGWDPVVLTRPKRLIESADPNYQRAFPGSIVEAGVLPHPIAIYRRLKDLLRRNRGGESPSSGPSGHLLPASRGEGARDPSPACGRGCRGAVGEGYAIGEGREERRRIRRWILSFLHMPDIYTGWILPATIAGLRVIHRKQITHIISSGPFWTNHLVGLILARLAVLPWTAHYRDPWNQVPQTKPVSAMSAAIERWLERLVISHADSVVCVTDTHARLLRQIFADLPADKFVTIPNGFDGEEWEACNAPQAQNDGRFVITYPGTFMMGTRSPRPLFRALRELIDAGDLNANSLCVELFGTCDVAEGMRVSEMAAQYGLQECAQIGPPLSRPDTLRRMLLSDLLLLLAEGWTLQIPGKTYEYLRAGRPILALTSDGALANLLRHTGGSWICDPADHAAIVGAIREAYGAWAIGQTARWPDPLLVADFDRRRLAGRFASLFNERLSLSAGPAVSLQNSTL
jgi:hypothetical protein